MVQAGLLTGLMLPGIILLADWLAQRVSGPGATQNVRQLGRLPFEDTICAASSPGVITARQRPPEGDPRPICRSTTDFQCLDGSDTSRDSAASFDR
jgi:hypothetical protein